MQQSRPADSCSPTLRTAGLEPASGREQRPTQRLCSGSIDYMKLGAGTPDGRRVHVACDLRPDHLEGIRPREPHLSESFEDVSCQTSGERFVHEMMGRKREEALVQEVAARIGIVVEG